MNLDQIKDIVRNEDRPAVLRKLYNLPKAVVAKILAFGKNKPVLYDRCQYAKQFGINCSVMRLLLDYTRYSEAFALAEALRSVTNLEGLKVLDYGAGAGDYAVVFGLAGAGVTIYDYQHMAECPVLRFERLNLKGTVRYVPDEPIPGHDLVIFSEVLEHLESPLDELKKCVESGVKYIFTTCYPYVGDVEAYFSKGGHTPEAKESIEASQKLLEEHFINTRLGRWHLLTRKS